MSTDVVVGKQCVGVEEHFITAVAAAGRHSGVRFFLSARKK
jgi:hypothetical protein